MNNFKKGLLSLAAIVAINTVSHADSYLPLTTVDNDYRWIMFGVNGFKTVGGTPSVDASFSTGNWSLATDSIKDEVAVNIEDAATKVWGSVKLLNVTTQTLTQITVNYPIDTATIPYIEEEPVRTMLVKAGGTSNADVLLTYKASLEGKKIEFQINDPDKTYEVVLSALNTYDNPASRGSAKAATPATGGVTLDTIAETLDYNLLNNPIDATTWVATDKDADSDA
jgi:hypothetical protein